MKKSKNIIKSRTYCLPLVITSSDTIYAFYCRDSFVTGTHLSCSTLLSCEYFDNDVKYWKSCDFPRLSVGDTIYYSATDTINKWFDYPHMTENGDLLPYDEIYDLSEVVEYV